MAGIANVCVRIVCVWKVWGSKREWRELLEDGGESACICELLAISAVGVTLGVWFSPSNEIIPQVQRFINTPQVQRFIGNLNITPEEQRFIGNLNNIPKYKDLVGI